MKKILVMFIFLLIIINIKASEIDLAKNSKSAILIEQSTGQIFYEKNSNEKRSPASMTKMMTLLLTMEAIESGKIKYDDVVTVSKNAASMGGTQIFIEEGSKIDVLTLIKGISIASANDAAVCLSEYIGGTEENFVLMMNKKAKELGCNNTNFKNPHGLDEEDHYTTAYDLSLIAKELLKHEKILEFTSTYETHIDVSGENHWLVNTNKLVKFYEGIDGLKTGYTDNALYCLTAAMKKNNMRVISVVMGVDTKENRNTDTIAMMEYAYSMYGSQTIIKKSDYIKEITIDNAKNRNVKYTLSQDVKLILNKDEKEIDYSYEEKIINVKAPLNKGEKIGILNLKTKDTVYQYDLVTAEDVKKNTYFDIVFSTFRNIVFSDK